MGLLIRLLLILGLIGLRAFFAAAEYALLGVRRTHLGLLAYEAHHRGRHAPGLRGAVAAGPVPCGVTRRATSVGASAGQPFERRAPQPRPCSRSKPAGGPSRAGRSEADRFGNPPPRLAGGATGGDDPQRFRPAPC